jgi:SAM-dependent methyltransferase
MDQATRNKIKDFWINRAIQEKFLWRDLLDLNFSLIKKHITPGCSVLDVGAGDGSLSLKMIEHGAGKVVAIDYVGKYLKNLHPNIEPVVDDIMNYNTNTKFDLIIVFGVMNFFDATEAVMLYKRMAGWLKESGVMIIKHQCGKLEDKIVDKYSEELDSHYIAHYRSVDHEIKLMTPAMPDGLLLTGDPYPEEYNKWPDTAFKVFEMHNEGKADHMPRI